ncbi:MAG: serine/threonine protein kinase [Acidobacteria bacterium]|nr:MAG: serine/threonine protein kinase [Acidobacteriota bacterium]
MGEVYRARDTKLGRDVATKVLPEEFARDKERMARFEREAKLLAQLNHPNIATLHGLEEHDGQLFLIMELVEGETLAERMAKGPIAVQEVLPLFLQIAEGLEAAHEKGIVHRDLKPANIKVTPDGRIKILDFGLAKAMADEDATDAGASQSPTLTRGTALGAIIGTAAYMSPEQARGKPVDKKADIWAIGSVLFEALSGENPFEGETVTDLLAAIIHKEPDWSALPGNLPTAIRNLLRHCLRKNLAHRLRDIGDARLAIEDASAESEPGSRSRCDDLQAQPSWSGGCHALGLRPRRFLDVGPSSGCAR